MEFNKKNKTAIVGFLTLYFFFIQLSFAQTQVVRGKVFDKHSGVPLEDVAVEIVKEERFGTETDKNGLFVIENIPIGRITIRFSSLNKYPLVLNNMELLGSKEFVLEVELEDRIEDLDVVELTISDKKKINNKQAIVSARKVDIEEVNKYAGTLNDVARMVMNYAGVNEVDDSKNDVVIRGNASRGLLWRMNDVDIPNPNHFGTSGATGGPISMINSNLLADSDFFIGAFVPEYVDAISGVFDLKMRKGNFYKHEFIGQLGLNGFELLAEGPIKKEKSSYLASYRYSFLDLMSNLGIDFGTGTAIPKYQDISFNTYFPIAEKGQLSVFGMGGNSQIHFSEDDDSIYTDDETTSTSKSGFAAVQYRHQWSDNTYSKATISYSAINSRDELTDPDNDDALTYQSDFNINTFELVTYVKTKFNKSSNLKAGIRLKQRMLDYLEFSDHSGIYRKTSDLDTDYYSINAYVSYFKRWNNKWTSVLGASSQYFQANEKATFEPRFSVAYNPNEKQQLDFGYGFHTQTPDLKYLAYYDAVNDIYPNEDLDYIKTHHFVIGYDLLIKKKLRIRVEAYYQSIVNATIAGMPTIFEDEDYADIYSSLNDNSFTNRDPILRTPQNLSDGGKGENYGVELTLEKQLNNGFYFLSTLSLFESKYKAKDKKWRNTTYNGNFVYNILAGNEWVLNNKMRLSADAKVVYAGGLREIPIDLDESNESGDLEYNYAQAYESKLKDYFRTDIRAGLKYDLKKVSQEWAIEVKNVFGVENVFNTDYDPVNNEITETYQLGVFPVFIYRIFF